MFPMEKPYKLLYSIHSLTVCLREEILEVGYHIIVPTFSHFVLLTHLQAKPDQDFISHSIQTLVAALTRPQMVEDLGENHLKLLFACNYVECLLLALSGIVDNSTTLIIKN
jgi:ubiquitin carboxyl-terminal hydrolase 34